MKLTHKEFHDSLIELHDDKLFMAKDESGAWAIYNTKPKINSYGSWVIHNHGDRLQIPIKIECDLYWKESLHYRGYPFKYFDGRTHCMQCDTVVLQHDFIMVDGVRCCSEICADEFIKKCEDIIAESKQNQWITLDEIKKVVGNIKNDSNTYWLDLKNMQDKIESLTKYLDDRTSLISKNLTDRTYDNAVSIADVDERVTQLNKVYANRLYDMQEAIDSLTKSLGEAHAKIIEFQEVLAK